MREDEVVLVEQRRAGELLRVRRRVEHQLGEELRARAASGPRAPRSARGRAGAPARCRSGARAAARRRCARRGPGPARRRGRRRRASRSSSTTAGQTARAGSGTRAPAHAAGSRRRRRRALRASAAAVLGPMPGTRPSTRRPAMASRGFSARRRKDTRSLTCAISTKRSPPYLWNGMLRRESSISSAMEWCWARNSTACCLSSVPCSRCSRMRSQSHCVCSSSSRQVASTGRPPSAALGPELLVAALGGLRDDGVGGRHDRRRGAVVARERAHLGAGEALLEVEDVAHRGGAEAVDGLGVVADAGDAGAVRAQQRDDVGLQRVGVLELVDQHVVEALAHAGAAGRVGEQPAPEQQQVVVVEHLLLLLERRCSGRRAAPGLPRPAGTRGRPCAAPRSAAAAR